MMAKTQEGLSAASKAFDHARCGSTTIRKEYTALVLGWPAWDEVTLDAPIEGDPASDFKMRTVTVKERLDGEGLHAPADNMIDAAVAARWGPSRMPPAPKWDRDGRAAKPREAVTNAVVLNRGHLALSGPLHGRKVALVKLRPITGRRHQLRVHLATAGHPLLGDVAYAGDISTHRLCLHASAITFSHGSGEPGVLPPDGLRIATHSADSTPFDHFLV
jgi:23S rRNA-/tRNA-specific pseudouridylate synthase